MSVTVFDRCVRGHPDLLAQCMHVAPERASWSCCCYRRRDAQPLVWAFGAVKHAQDKASQTAHAGLVSSIIMHSCTNRVHAIHGSLAKTYHSSRSWSLLSSNALWAAQQRLQVRGQRRAYRERRALAPIPVVALVGYTNAGKARRMMNE
jgi:hypothetical protein